MNHIHTETPESAIKSAKNEQGWNKRSIYPDKGVNELRPIMVTSLTLLPYLMHTPTNLGSGI